MDESTDIGEGVGLLLQVSIASLAGLGFEVMGD